MVKHALMRSLCWHVRVWMVPGPLTYKLVCLSLPHKQAYRKMATLQDVILTLNRVPIIPVIQTEPVNYGKLPPTPTSKHQGHINKTFCWERLRRQLFKHHDAKHAWSIPSINAFATIHFPMQMDSGREREERLFFMGLWLASGLTYNTRSHTINLQIYNALLREHAIGSTKAVCLHNKWGSYTQNNRTNKCILYNDRSFVL